MLYKKNNSETLSKELFKNPSSEYRGAPFWSWNCKITKEIVEKQTEYFKEMGFGGFHIHSRTGMDVPYLSDEFMDLIKFSVEKAREKGLLAWLYDEDRYPSGAAGGFVTKTPKYRARHLMLTKENRINVLESKEKAIEDGNEYFYAAYDICLNEKGELVSYKKIGADEKAEGRKFYAYVCPMEKRGWYNNLTYADTMNKEAMDKFIEITHERYKEAVGKDFDGVVPAIFTDEPQVSKKETFAYGDRDEIVNLPWSFVMDEIYEKRYGCRIEDTVPELFWELPDGKISKARYFYHDFVCEIFNCAFLDNMGKWCDENGIALTGHVMGEQWLKTQTEHLGEAMRCYRSFEIPGIDMLGDDHEYMTAKQCQSVVHQYGREGMLSEIYGVTGWDYDFRGHKNQGDWQAALGVTVRVPHLSWMSMHGDAKRDYPASVFYQSPWYKEYGYIENHFARLNTALTRGKPIVDIAVIHPIESYWLHWGPSVNTADARDAVESNHVNVIEWLLFSQLDFDFVSESMLPELYSEGENNEKTFNIGKMKYKTVIVPALETMRGTTLDALWKFKNAGGRIIFMGECPAVSEGELSDEPGKLYNACETIQFTKMALLKALESDRNVEIRYDNGTRTSCYLTNYRQDKDSRWLFTARGLKAGGKYSEGANLKIKVKGVFTPEIYDTLSGNIYVPKYEIADDNTVISVRAYEVDSFLIRLGEYNSSKKAEEKPQKLHVLNKMCHSSVKYALEEDNAMVLDIAEYRVDSKEIGSDGEWYEAEELQRVHNICAKIAGLPKYNDTQPWADVPENLEHFVDLHFEFESETEYEGAYLAIENADLVKAVLNGAEACGTPCGYFVDESIEKIRLPKIRKGHNDLYVRTPIGVRTKIEWCYLLGKFGVKLSGLNKTITKLPEKLGFMSLDMQELPFYTGNITYFDTIDVPRNTSSIKVRVSEFEGALVKVLIDGEEKGIIAFDPFETEIEGISPGKHEIAFKYFGTRGNAFGALHNADVNERWKGPNVWQTRDNKWCLEYRTRKSGIMAAPVVEFLK